MQRRCPSAVVTSTPGQNEKIVDRQTVKPHQAFLEQIIDSVAGVVIGDGDAVQTFGARGRDQIFRAGNTVAGKKRMRVQVDIKRHGDYGFFEIATRALQQECLLRLRFLSEHD